ncbi:DamX protein [uncultured Paraglaciecola sp.]|uniref:SPOR domain-containing protein n=1 Tax=uncultured Paraglaciecola sp. TaxID=1765024 RepID=UPI002598C310|nr:DamX protein [uncultured Paraglaciecola sp.]
MATTELSDRLDYLISYSSQLVFVCTDKIKQQSRVVESFLSQQDDQTDVALVNADPLTPLASYRETIFKQLLTNTQNVDFHRPLNQLLAPLNNKDGTALISIFQADNLPNKLVKEIWELVLQSRFANNKQHLNVLLMGESSWAEQMKSGLASHSRDKPIILKSSISPIAECSTLGEENFESLENTDLEAFLQHNRQKFAERIKDRNQSTYVHTSLLKKWWMITLLSMVFVLTFAGILSWQYSDNILKWVAAYNTAEAVNETPSLPIKVEKLTQINEEPIVDKTQTSEQLPKLEIQHDLDTLLVTDWETAVAEIEGKVESKVDTQVPIKNNVMVTEQPIEKASEFPVSAPPELIVTSIETSTPTKVSTEQDYAVPDITSEPQSTVAAEISDPQLPELKTAETRYLNDLDAILALSDSHFVIQIAAMTNFNALMNYIKDEKLESQIWIYPTYRNAVKWYVLLNNQSFPSVEAANLHRQKLPAAMLKNNPFVKRVMQIKQEIAIQVH